VSSNCSNKEDIYEPTGTQQPSTSQAPSTNSLSIIFQTANAPFLCCKQTFTSVANGE
jgi:hypothetical protein